MVEPISSMTTLQAQNSFTKEYDNVKSNNTNNQSNNVINNIQPIDTNVLMIKESNSKGNPNNQNKEKNDKNEQLKKMLDKMTGGTENTEVSFGIHEKTNRVTIKIVDKKTKETIKELPPEKTLDMIAKAWELAGLFIDERR